MTVSPSAGATSGWISVPAVPFLKNGASGASQMCCMCRIGSPFARKRSSACFAASAAASGPTSG
jgi:hypothetical protein